MTHRASPEFWDAFYDLPPRIQQMAERKRDLMMEDPRAVNLKKVGAGYWSARVNRQYRALGIDHPEISNGIARFWIGKHDEYERIINK